MLGTYQYKAETRRKAQGTGTRYSQDIGQRANAWNVATSSFLPRRHVVHRPRPDSRHRLRLEARGSLIRLLSLVARIIDLGEESRCRGGVEEVSRRHAREQVERRSHFPSMAYAAHVCELGCICRGMDTRRAL